MTLETRIATRADLPGMAAVLNPIIRAGGTTAYETEMTPAELARVTFDKPGLISLFVALDEAEIAGFQWLSRMPYLPYDVGDIATFARQAPKIPGVGRALFAATLEAARAEGLREINAKIRADNTSGLGFYTAIGFQDHSVDRAVPLADGTPVDRVQKRFRL